VIKPVDKETYPLIVQWWKGHNFPILPLEALSSQGYIAYQDNKPVCAGFLYLPRPGDGVIAWVEWFVANPLAAYEERSKGFQDLLDYMGEIAKKNGIITLVTFTGSKKMEKRFEECGFQTIESGAYLMKFLDENLAKMAKGSL
jgi:hypothetical protein